MRIKTVAAPVLALSVALAYSVPSHAGASLTPGIYIQGGAGANVLRDNDIEVGGVERRANYDAGWLGAFSAGYAWANGLRAELEYGHRSNAVDTLGGGGANGDVHVNSLMVNAIYAFPTRGWLQPFIGLGLGGARVKLDSVMPLGSTATAVNNSDWAPAAQGIVGVEYPLDDNLGLSLSYRYFYARDTDYTAVNGAAANMGSYQSHAVLVALRWSFGTPAQQPAPIAPPRQQVQAAPAPAPAPAPQARRDQPPRQYIVFFDFDSAALTSDAQSIVRTAAQSSQQSGITRIELTGHTDRSGSDAYNMGLSQRRAATVRAELVRLGVPANQITIFSKGERENLVPTADGVREPQNRRVHIVFP
jgi:outer membrane protein OmpA-like peptidoglycan-associated protein